MFTSPSKAAPSPGLCGKKSSKGKVASSDGATDLKSRLKARFWFSFLEAWHGQTALEARMEAHEEE
jgi:hypothetical protein